ncbi:hypothetical protein [Limnohabitans sp.]|uniref:hypothetical protein n=1 Tax=Limnohabitans sp. TaxID=1907725 RepID=UPI00286F6CC6|nr:hypothetical protein [Limnohabitans sp.]
MPFIYSRLAADQAYTIYVAGTTEQVPVIEQTISIKGGADVASRNIITMQGVATEVTDAQLEALQKNHVFGIHLENEHLVIDKKKRDADEVGADLKKDPSAPKTDADLASEDVTVTSMGKNSKGK